jgi:hypothetical protein
MYGIFDEFINQFRENIHNRICPTDSYKQFFNECNNYVLISLKKTENKPVGIKQIIRMIGLFPIDKQNFELPHDPTKNFTFAIMSELSKSLEDVINCLTKDEWDLFKEGLGTLLCIQLLSKSTGKSSANPLELLLNEAIESARLDIVKIALRFFKNIGKDPPESIWFELLVLDSPEGLIYNNRMQDISFETYLKCATKIVPMLAKRGDYINYLSPHFDHRIKNKQFFSKCTH